MVNIQKYNQTKQDSHKAKKEEEEKRKASGEKKKSLEEALSYKDQPPKITNYYDCSTKRTSIYDKSKGYARRDMLDSFDEQMISSIEKLLSNGDELIQVRVKGYDNPVAKGAGYVAIFSNNGGKKQIKKANALKNKIKSEISQIVESQGYSLNKIDITPEIIAYTKIEKTSYYGYRNSHHIKANNDYIIFGITLKNKDYEKNRLKQEIDKLEQELMKKKKDYEKYKP